MVKWLLIASCIVRSLLDAPPLSNEFYSGFDDVVLDTKLALHLEIIRDIFLRHCLWTLPDSFIRQLHHNSEYNVPLLFNASIEHCQGSALPVASVDLWIQHADVVVREDSKRDETERDLHHACIHQNLSGLA